MYITNVVFTGSEIRRVIERSGLPMETQSQLWNEFLSFASIEKRLGVIREDPHENSDDEHLFV